MNAMVSFIRGRGLILLLLLGLNPTLTLSQSLTLGQTYDIVEPDVLEEIKQRAQGVDWQAVYQKDPTSWGGFQSPRLPNARHQQVREHKPVYIVEQDVIDRQGQIIYPKGYVYNPLQYLQLPSRIIFIGRSEAHLIWLNTVINETDTIITAGGDPITLSKKIGRPVFLLNERWLQRFNLQVVPSIVEQHKDRLLITEYAIHQEASHETPH